MRFIVSCMLVLISLVSLAQKKEIDTYFVSLRNKQPVSSFSFEPKKESQYLKPLAVYLEDTIPAIRIEAYYLLRKLGEHTPQKNLRKEVVNLLLRGYHDTDAGIKAQAENSLTRFRVQDFDCTAIDTLKSILNNLPPSPGRLFRLAGYLGMNELAPKIKSYIEEQQPPLPSKDRWAGYLALARMGDQHALDIILNRVRTFGTNDDVAYEIFPDLVYTRSYRAIHYLEEVMFSNEENCSSPYADAQSKTNCAYRIIELLAPVIKDYPVALDASGDLATTDYPQALEKIRNWFKQKNGTYEIIRDTF
jgi:hypothetical protein